MFKFNFPKFNFEEDKAESVPEPVIEVEVPEEPKTFDEMIMDTVKEQATDRVYNSLSRELVTSWYKSKGVDVEELIRDLKSANAPKGSLGDKYRRNGDNLGDGLIVIDRSSFNYSALYRRLSVEEVLAKILKEHAESIVEESYNAK